MLMRFDPFRDLDRLTRDVWGETGRHLASMPIDAYRVGDRFSVDLDVPGVDPASVELTVEKNVLTVSAERARSWDDGAEVLVHERPEGRFSRQLFLGDTLDPDGIQASCDNGVLTITIPVAERAKARRVQIGHGGGQPASIETKATSAA